MQPVSKILKASADGELVSFRCPGCKNTHMVNVKNDVRPAWSYNGNPDAPSFQPSILVRNGHFAEGYDGKGCWCDLEARLGIKSDFKCVICHSYVTDGQIQFLSDCSHELAGQTVPLPEFIEE